jgi:spermidine/putrescine transport system permease protein
LSIREENTRPRPHPAAFVVTVGAYALLLLPLLAVLIYSFIEPIVGAEATTWRLSLVWYERLFHDEVIAKTLVTSLQVASCATIVATIIGVAGAIALERGDFPGRRLLAAVTMVPLVMPELVMGLASLIWFSLQGLGLGIHTLIMGHATFALAYVITIVRARLANFDGSLEEAAADLGATPWVVFRKITLPIIAPGVGAGAMMAFTLSFDDFLISFFTAGVDSDTLPMRLYSMIRFGLNREIYALSSLLILVTAIGIVGSYRLRRV